MMGINLADVLRIGVADGFIWFPFVLGVGLLFTYFKEIDISVDGIAVLSGIASAFVWRLTGSYFLSLTSGIVTGIMCSTIVCWFQTIMRISGLMAGIVFSLASHSLSVILIGESLVLPDTHLLSGFGQITLWQIVVTLFLILVTLFFYNTHFGTAVRKLGNGCTANTVYSMGLLRWSAYALSGFLYGFGGALYTHAQGLAKSGGSFEFLLVSLCAYLCTVRFADLLVWVFRKFRETTSSGVQVLSQRFLLLNYVLSSPAIKALFGAIIFETLLFITITFSPNPMLWKLVFAILLLLALSKPKISTSLCHSSEKMTTPSKSKSLEISDISIHYDIGSEKREVFNNASGDFKVGINLIRGPNGAGKSTLLKSIAGFVRPNAGVITFDGNLIMQMPEHKRPCFLIQQNPMEALSKELTVSENLFATSNNCSPWHLNLNSQAAVKKLISLLKSLSVAPIKPSNDPFWNKPVMTLSGGEAHCVALYCAILSKRQILLADEPTTGLDSENFDKLTVLLKALAQKYIVLLTSHDNRVNDLAKRYFIVGKGKIIIDSEKEKSHEDQKH